MTSRAVVLASASPRRRELLARLVGRFDIETAGIDESTSPDEPPAAYAARLALEKASAVAARRPDAIVVGADTVVVHAGEILGKPEGAEEAGIFLARLRGVRHVVITAVAVVDGHHGGVATGAEHTGVWLRAYAASEVEAYIATGDPFDKAGGYAVQHPVFAPVRRLEGSETNVVGLPIHLTRRLLARRLG
jgi:septum formation protein